MWGTLEEASSPSRWQHHGPEPPLSDTSAFGFDFLTRSCHGFPASQSVRCRGASASKVSGRPEPTCYVVGASSPDSC